MKPKTREQNFLAKIAGDANADTTMKPRTAEEYFLNQIAENGGGGSSLPSYSSSDIGKVLTVGEASPVETEVVVVPEQTVTVSHGTQYYYASLADVNIDWSNATAGDSISLTVNGSKYTANYSANAFGAPAFVAMNGSSPIAAVANTGSDKAYVNTFLTAASGEYTVSATAVQSVTPSVQTVIVPEQTVTVISEEQFVAALAGVDTSFFGTLQDGDAVPFVVDGATITGTVHINAPTIVIANPEYPFYILYTSEDVEGFSAGTYFRGQSGGTHTVSLTASAPKIEAKWETGGDVKYIFIGSPDGNNSADYGIYSDESLSNQLDEDACNTLIETLKTSTIICRIPRGSGRYYEYRGYWTNSRNKVLFVVELSGSSLVMKTVGYMSPAD